MAVASNRSNKQTNISKIFGYTFQYYPSNYAPVATSMQQDALQMLQ